jgi:uncharacterized protein (DUF952 family)
MAIIFHIALRGAWASPGDQRLGFYRPEAFQVEGFIHCSTRAQVIKVADTRFRGQTGLVLLCIETDRVAGEIRYENLEGGQELFPHIYGELNKDAVVNVAEFEPDVDGYFTLPSMLSRNANC